MKPPMLFSFLTACDQNEPNPNQSRVIDEDKDGIPADKDCDDTDASIPDATGNCDTVTDTDTENTPHSASTNDTGTTIHTGTSTHTGTSPECDEYIVDDVNCPGRLIYRDSDGDSFGSSFFSQVISLEASTPSDFVENDLDCDDNNSNVNPNATETCTTNFDDNCDGNINEVSSFDAATWYQDSDQDGFGNINQTETACAPSVGYTSNSTDCNDSRNDVYPGAPEICGSSEDLNCDNVTPNTDADNDGFASCNDCDDTSATVNPAQAEVCDSNNIDENCNGLANDLDPNVIGQVTYFTDADYDGFGDETAVGVLTCNQPNQSSTNNLDCDDSNASINPNTIWYTDSDGDGFGLNGSDLAQCERPTNAVSTDGDCNDSNTNANPAQNEICDAFDVDEDCDGLINDADPSSTGKSTFFADVDNDGFGDENASAELFCELPANYSTTADDCDDNLANVNPGVFEICQDGIDNDCSVTTSSACQPSGFVDANLADIVYFGNTGDEAGFSIASDGDLNGDGYDDLLISGIYADPSPLTDAGGVYLNYGSAAPLASYNLLTECDASVFGDTSGSYLGQYIAYAGDMNGDGFDEAAISTGDYRVATEPQNYDYMLQGIGTTQDGAVYFIDGSATALNGLIDLGTLPLIVGETLSGLGASIAGGGDADGDGLHEVTIGAPGWNNDIGAAYAIHGTISGNNDIASLVASGQAYSFEGELPGHEAGAGVAYVGNTAGIGTGCENYLAIGAPGYDVSGLLPNAGAVYLLDCAEQTNNTPLSSVAIKITGEGSNDEIGHGFSAAGDHNGDGIADLAIVAPGKDSNSGGIYVINGPITTGGSVTDLFDHVHSGIGTQNVTWVDLNNDGFDDMVVGSWSHPGQTGQAKAGVLRVFYGPLDERLEEADPARDLFIYGLNSYSNLGWDLNRGDINGDGLQDLVVSARKDYTSSAVAGSTYVFLGFSD